VAATVVVGTRQAHSRFAANGFWPVHFQLAHTLVWGAVLLLVGDAAAQLVRDRRRR